MTHSEERWREGVSSKGTETGCEEGHRFVRDELINFDCAWGRRC